MKNKILYNILFFILYSFQFSPLNYAANYIADCRRYYRALCRCYYYYYLSAVSACRICDVSYVILLAPCAVSYCTARALTICAPCLRLLCCIMCAVSASLLFGVSNIRRHMYLLHNICAAPGPLISGTLYAPCRRK